MKNPLSHVDRVEVIEVVYEIFSVPRARSLVADAGRLLRHVLCDLPLLQDLLDELDPGRASPAGR